MHTAYMGTHSAAHPTPNTQPSPRRYKQGKVGMRWRTKAEVLCGKGQFSCGAKGCEETRGLASFEVNFAYQVGVLGMQ